MEQPGFSKLTAYGEPSAFVNRLPKPIADWWRDNKGDIDGLVARGYRVANQITPAHDPRTHTATGGAWNMDATPITITREIVEKNADLSAARERQKRLIMAHGEIDQIRREVVPDLVSQDATYGLKLVFALLATYGSAGMKEVVKPIIEAEADLLGITEAALTPTIIAQGVAWSIANETMEGMRRAFSVALDAAGTVADLDEIPDLDLSSIRTSLGLPEQL